MTAEITSSLRLALVAGSGITIQTTGEFGFGGFGLDVYGIDSDLQLADSGFTTDDIVNPDNPVQSLTDWSGNVHCVNMVGAAVVDGSFQGNTTIYRVPGGQIFIPTQILFVLTGITGSGAAPELNVGMTGAFNQLIDSSAHPGIFAAIQTLNQIIMIKDFTAVGTNFRYLIGGEVLTARVRVATTFSTYTLKAFAFGYQFGQP
jgi:hypothetical protein